MNNYVLPAATFRQEFAALASDVQHSLYSCIIAPKRKVVKAGFSPASETSYGSYLNSAPLEYEFLALPSGESVDDGSVSVVMTDVKASFATISGANEIEAGSAPNEVKLGATPLGLSRRLAAFSNGTTSYSRLADLGSRDVKVGDFVKVTHEDGVLSSRVTELVQSKTAVAVDATTPNASTNPATQAADDTVAILEDKATGRSAAHYSTVDSNYVGNLVTGKLTDTYTLEITLAGAQGTAEFKYTSVNGDSGTGVVTPADNATAVAVGNFGLEVLMDDATADFVVGEKWTIEVDAAYTQAGIDIDTAEYGGTIDTTYQIKVIRGGLFADGPKISVTTNNNVDSSTADEVTAEGETFKLGQFGPTVSIAEDSLPQGGLRLGDVYNVTVTAPVDDGVTSFLIKDPLPSVDGNDDPINAEGADLQVEFLVGIDEIEIPAGDFPESGDLNWTVGTDTITLESGIRVTDASVTDGVGGLEYLSVDEANLSIFYTAILKLQANQLGTISTQSSIPGILGDVLPENEAAYGVDMALSNSGGQTVYYITTSGDTEADYREALREAEKNSDVYFIVPMSHKLEIQDLIKTHVISMSSEDVGMERVAVVNRTVADELDLFVKKENNSAWTGYVAAGPELDPAEYRKLTIPTADFVTVGVQPGDLVRLNYSISVTGEEIFETYTVQSVTDEENLLIVDGPDGPVGSVGNLSRIEIVHPYTKQQKAELAAAQSEFFGDRRVTNIFPDSAVAVNGETVPGYYMAAAYAGLKSSVVAHQPITNFEITGFLSVPQVLNDFSIDELNQIASGGTAIIAQEVFGGQLFIRHQLTTDMTDVNHQELAITTNADSITKYLRSVTKPLIGRNNISDEFLIQLETLSHQRLDFLIQQTYTLSAGPQIEEVGQIRATRDPLVQTRVIQTIPLELPNAANNILTILKIS